MSSILKIILIGAIILILGMTAWLVFRHVLIINTENKADHLISAALDGKEHLSENDKIVNITRGVFQSFQHQNPSQIKILKLRPLLTNYRLPSWFRLPDGIIEMNLEKGYCDNAARMLAFILKRAGYESLQWDMIFPTRSHSALLVNIRGGLALLDPFYGYVAINKDGKLTDPYTAKARIESGEIFDNVFIPLGSESDPAFYRDFQNVSMAAQGEPLVLESVLPLLKNTSLTLGEINSDDQDVKDAATARGLNPYWHYMGHKYNRGWVRILRAQEPVQITMTLVDPPQAGILNAKPTPRINGKNLSWTLKAGETLTLTDGDAKLSLKRLNSYIGIDRITITRANRA